MKRLPNEQDEAMTRIDNEHAFQTPKNLLKWRSTIQPY